MAVHDINLSNSGSGGDSYIQSNIKDYSHNIRFVESNLPYHSSGGASICADDNYIYFKYGYGYSTSDFAYTKFIKWDGEKWEYINTSTNINLTYVELVLYKNEIHALGGMNSSGTNYNSHYVFRNNNWVQLNNLPSNFYNGSATIFNDTIYLATGGSSSTIYVYNNTNDRWSSINAGNAITTLFTHNNELYGYYFPGYGSNGSLYKYIDDTFTRINNNVPKPYSSPANGRGKFISFNGKLYFFIAGEGTNIGGNISPSCDMYEYTDNGFVLINDSTFMNLSHMQTYSQSPLLTIFKDKLYYISTDIYSSNANDEDAYKRMMLCFDGEKWVSPGIPYMTRGSMFNFKGDLYIAGGFNIGNSGSYSNTQCMLKYTNDGWVDSGVVLPYQSANATIGADDNYVYFFGGKSTGGYSQNKIYRWDGNNFEDLISSIGDTMNGYLSGAWNNRPIKLNDNIFLIYGSSGASGGVKIFNTSNKTINNYSMSIDDVSGTFNYVYGAVLLLGNIYVGKNDNKLYKVHGNSYNQLTPVSDLPVPNTGCMTAFENKLHILTSSELVHYSYDVISDTYTFEGDIPYLPGVISKIVLIDYDNRLMYYGFDSNKYHYYQSYELGNIANAYEMYLQEGKHIHAPIIYIEYGDIEKISDSDYIVNSSGYVKFITYEKFTVNISNE